MALIIEDGDIVANANSYATVAEAREYATARGLTFSATDSVVEALLVKAADFLESLESRFKGYRTANDSGSVQPLAWPRSDVYLFDSYTVTNKNSIPDILKKAQCQLAYDASQTDLLPTGDGRETIREKVDVLEVEYAPRGSGSVIPVTNQANAFLAPLLKTGSGAGMFRTIRV